MVYVADSLSAVADSDSCTINNLLPNHAYPVKVVFKNSHGVVSLPSATILCTTKSVPVAGVPLYVDFAGEPHGQWVPENIWSDTVAHGMLEHLQKEFVPIGMPGSNIDTVMATIFEGEMHYSIRAPRDEYVLTLCLYDPFEHSSARTFTISVDGSAHADSVISSPGMLNGIPWSALVSFHVITDSMIRFSLAKDSSLLPISSGFTLLSVTPFTVTVADTVAIGDTLHIGWTCNQVSVSSAIIYVSADSGKFWSIINAVPISRSDSSWGRFNWGVPAALDQQRLDGVNLTIKVSDYNKKLFGTAHCFVQNTTRIKAGLRQPAGRLKIMVGNNCIRIRGNFKNGTARTFRLNGTLVRSMALPGPKTLDLSKLPHAIYLVELQIDGTTYRHKILIR
jgi:hypothetical protein